jgi:hypothetical protein
MLSLIPMHDPWVSPAMKIALFPLYQMLSAGIEFPSESFQSSSGIRAAAMHWQEFEIGVMVQPAVLEAYVSEVLHQHSCHNFRLHLHGKAISRLHWRQLTEHNIIVNI